MTTKRRNRMIDRSVPKKDPITIPAVWAFEMEESVEWTESDDLEVAVLHVTGEGCGLGAMAIVEGVRDTAGAGCGGDRHPQRKDRTDGRMLDMKSDQEPFGRRRY